MNDLATGMLVQHVSLGIGRVVAVEPTAVHVFFPESEKRYAAKLRWPAARPLLKTGGGEGNAWLESLSSFSLDPETGRYALAANWITHDQAIADFLSAHPQAFADPKTPGTGRGDRASMWRAASAEWARAFGDGEGERLLAAGNVREMVRRALRIERHVTLASAPFEAGALRNALRHPDAARAFFEALLALLSVPSPGRARFERLFAATEQLELEPELAWPLATLFPFVAEPTRHVFLWPRSACPAAERLGCDLRFEATPNWATYASLRQLSARLLEKLRESGARDFMHVEAFLHATSARSTPGSKARHMSATRSSRATTLRNGSRIASPAAGLDPPRRPGGARRPPVV